MVRNLNNPRALITGGTGYLGSRIGASLAKHGYDVYLGSRNPFVKGIVKGCNQVVTDWDDCELAFCKDFDLIIHAAGMNVYDCAQNPGLALKFNGQITGKLAQKAAFYGCKRFIYLSTVHVYNSPLVGDFDEQAPVLNGHPYATSHHFGEQQVLSVAKNSYLDCTVLRLSNSFGYPVTHQTTCWGLVLNEFIRDAFLKGQITINGDCFSKRDFLPITELNRILIEILYSPELIPEVINVSSGTSKTLLEVALQVSDAVFEFSGTTVELVNEIGPKTDLKLNIKNRALEKIGIFANNDLKLEISKMLDFLSLAAPLAQD
jgi:UDP-glucose 4-epimerase